MTRDDSTMEIPQKPSCEAHNRHKKGCLNCIQVADSEGWYGE